MTTILVLSFTAHAQTPATYHARADQAMESFLMKYWKGSSQYLRQNYPDTGSLTGYWTYANGWYAVLDNVERTGGQRFRGMIESFYLGQNQRGWYSSYYDDECWMIVALIRSYDLTGQAKYLTQAEIIFEDVKAAWDTTCCGPSPGGTWWDKAHTQKATAANAGAALASAMLYRRTGIADYLTFAQQVYSYWYAQMVNTTTHQVGDHFNTDGTKVWWKFTYNEGLMIGAALELNEATGSASYLANAHSIAIFMINQEVFNTIYGNVLYDGTVTGCTGDCAQFKGPAIRNLARLFAKDPTRSQYYNVLKAGSDAIWNLARNSTQTIFCANWAGPVVNNTDVSADNSACAALSQFAFRAGAYPGSGHPTGVYEAEEATIHHINLENAYPGFTGWGYTAAWNANDQWVQFDFHLPTAGTRTVSLRYAAGAGNAARLITINGANAVTKLTFNGTGAWSSYGTNKFNYNFTAGSNSLAVVYNSTYASANYLNLDSLIIADQNIRISDIKPLPVGGLSLSWNSISGLSYHVQYCNSLGSGLWSNLTGSITANSSTTTATDANPPHGSPRYYRVVQP